VRPPRVVTYGGGAPASLSSDGADTAEHLIAAQLRSTDDPLIGATGRFFSAFDEQLVLDSPIGGVWRVLLRPKQAPKIDVNLCDTGEGYAQVLPVLVALARACLGEGPKVLCLEQPELHLHTKAQLELSKLMVECASHASKPKILVETHSEVLLNSVQLAIAKNEISADMVRVYWVEARENGTSNAIPIDFDDFGRPNSSLLTDAFGESAWLSGELITSQLNSTKRVGL
jgi:predicted ATPase